MAGVKKSSLQSLLQGTMLPDLPPTVSIEDKPKSYSEQEVIWKRKLVEYLRRLAQGLTGPNIFNELIEQSTIEEYITTIINNNSTPTSETGVGPIAIDVYADYAWVSSATAFGGTLVGTIKAASLTLDNLQDHPTIGQNHGIGGIWTKTRAVRIRCKVVPEYTENYTFELTHDDGGRLYVNGVLKINSWGSGSTDATSAIALTAGVPVVIVIEVVNNGSGGFQSYLRWNSNSIDSGGGQVDIPYSRILAP